eukprot:2890354-Heterocapsa_arctica.AAC.1
MRHRGAVGRGTSAAARAAPSSPARGGPSPLRSRRASLRRSSCGPPAPPASDPGRPGGPAPPCRRRSAFWM